MSLEVRVYSHLTGSTTVTGITDTRVYPVTLPEDVDYEAITYRTISEVTDQLMSVEGSRATRVEITSYGETATESQTLGAAVRARMSRWSSSTGSPNVLATFIDNEVDLYDPETKTFGRALDVICHHTT